MKLRCELNASGDLDHAIIDLSPAEIQRILRYMDLVKDLKAEDEKVYSIEVFDYSADFVEADWGAVLDDEDDATAPADEDEKCKYKKASTECDTMIITEDTVEWQANLKHADVIVRTEPIPRKNIEEVASS